MEKIQMNPDNDLKYRDGLYPTKEDSKNSKKKKANEITTDQCENTEEKLEYFTE